MKITIYELFGMAKDGKAPKKIKYNTFELKRTMSNNLSILYVDENNMFFPKNYRSLTLNDEVEIIEEENKIPEKLENYYDVSLEEYVVETYIKGVHYKEIFNSKYDEMIISKLNEILDYLKLKKSLESKGE